MTELVPFGGAAAPGIDAVAVAMTLDGGRLVVQYRVEGALERLRVPGLGEALDPERLWACTCLELFVGLPGERYVEHNFSPSGQVACFGFTRYRERESTAPELQVATSITRSAGQLVVTARVELPDEAERLSPTAVLQLADGTCTYWAQRHPGERPDFHHPDGWAPRARWLASDPR